MHITAIYRADADTITGFLWMANVLFIAEYNEKAYRFIIDAPDDMIQQIKADIEMSCDESVKIH